MKELLEKILATDLLNEETKGEIATAFTQLVEEQVQAARAETELTIRTQLTEQWVTERDALIDALDAQITSLVESELKELKDDISSYRDLEVEYAGKLVESRQELAKQLDSDIYTLATQLDEFIDMKLRAEMTELTESIEEVKRNELGRRAFEMFAREYQSSFVNKSAIERELAESKRVEAQLKQRLSEAEQKFSNVERDRKMADLLAPLSGKQRAVMETILKSVPTEKLEEGYNMFLARVLSESKQPAQEGGVLAEGVESGEKKVVTGNAPTAINESATVPQALSPDIEKLRRLAGIGN